MPPDLPPIVGKSSGAGRLEGTARDRPCENDVAGMVVVGADEPGGTAVNEPSWLWASSVADRKEFAGFLLESPCSESCSKGFSSASLSSHTSVTRDICLSLPLSIALPFNDPLSGAYSPRLGLTQGRKRTREKEVEKGKKKRGFS